MIYCTNCGKQINDDVNFCPNCGNSVNGCCNSTQNTKNDDIGKVAATVAGGAFGISLLKRMARRRRKMPMPPCGGMCGTPRRGPHGHGGRGHR